MKKFKGFLRGLGMLLVVIVGVAAWLALPWFVLVALAVLFAALLLVGVLVFVFYLFQAPPLLFNPAHESAVREGAGTEYAALEARHGELWSQREMAARALGADEVAGAAERRDDHGDAGEGIA